MTTRPRIAREDLEPVLAAHHGNEALRAAFEGAEEAGRFLSVLARYVQFNSVFGPGLANLAGEIAARQGNALKAMKIEILGEKHDAYYWIHIHTGVEAEHFDAALRGVNSALRFYAGAEGPAEVKRFMLAGFARFAEVQAGFMDGLAEA